jgi:hypothetical protein
MNLPTRTAPALATLAALASLALASAAPAAELALSGIRGLVVEVEAPPGEVAPYGLTRESLEEALGAALGDRRVAAGESHDVARLRLNMNTSLYGFYSWALRLQVERAIAVAGEEGAFTTKPVWSVGEQGTMLPHEARRLEDVSRRLAEQLRQALPN